MGAANLAGLSEHSAEHEWFEGAIAEVMVFDLFLARETVQQLMYYLSKKWSLERETDSDGDGVMDFEDETPAPGVPNVGMADTATAYPTNFHALRLWLSAGETANSAPSTSSGVWKDLSGYGHDVAASVALTDGSADYGGAAGGLDFADASNNEHCSATADFGFRYAGRIRDNCTAMWPGANGMQQVEGGEQSGLRELEFV